MVPTITSEQTELGGAMLQSRASVGNRGGSTSRPRRATVWSAPVVYHQLSAPPPPGTTGWCVIQFRPGSADGLGQTAKRRPVVVIEADVGSGIVDLLEFTSKDRTRY